MSAYDDLTGRVVDGPMIRGPTRFAHHEPHERHVSQNDEHRYSRILLKLSGEALCSSSGHGVETPPARWIAKEIRAAVETGVQMSVVVGGGNFIRGEVLERDGGFDRATTDAMGMLGTVINAIALASIMDAEGVRARALSAVESGTTCERYTRQRGKELMRAGEVVVIGGGTSNPYFTTDSAATLRAAELDCDAVLKATKVDGVYSDDPKTNPDATRFATLCFDEAIDKGLRVMDTSAFALARDRKIPIVVFDYSKERNIERVVRGEDVGTVVS